MSKGNIILYNMNGNANKVYHSAIWFSRWNIAELFSKSACAATKQVKILVNVANMTWQENGRFRYE